MQTDFIFNHNQTLGIRLLYLNELAKPIQVPLGRRLRAHARGEIGLATACSHP